MPQDVGDKVDLGLYPSAYIQATEALGPGFHIHGLKKRQQHTK